MTTTNKDYRWLTLLDAEGKAELDWLTDILKVSKSQIGQRLLRAEYYRLQSLRQK